MKLKCRLILECGVPLAAATLMIYACRSQGQDATNSTAALPRRPNIVLILADDLGYGDLGCYGQTKIKTPNLDRMAAEGMRFTSFYAGSAVCSPARAALMLGKHTGHLDIRGNATTAVLQSGDVTVAQVLKDVGYRTGLLGKWGLSREGSTGSPQSMGFEEFAGYLDNKHAHDYYPEFIWRYDPPRGGQPAYEGKVEFPKNAGGARVEYTPDLFTEAALNFLRINKPDEFNRYRPFFLMLSLTIPHANNEAFRAGGDGMPVPGDEPYTQENWPQVEKNKAAMITRMDTAIGKLTAKLQQLHIASNTLVLFMSDNGPHKEGGVDPAFFNSSGNLRGIKRDLYEGGVRVPMVAWWPGTIRSNQVCDVPVAAWDFPATAAAIGMGRWPTNTDSISFLPLLTGRKQTNQHEFLYWEFHERGFQQAARSGDWKAVRPQAGEKLELYNLRSDPGETNNVAAKNPDVVARFESYFKTAHTDSDKWPIKKQAAQAAAEAGKE